MSSPVSLARSNPNTHAHTGRIRALDSISLPSVEPFVSACSSVRMQKSQNLCSGSARLAVLVCLFPLTLAERATLLVPCSPSLVCLQFLLFDANIRYANHGMMRNLTHLAALDPPPHPCGFPFCSTRTFSITTNAHGACGTHASPSPSWSV